MTFTRRTATAAALLLFAGCASSPANESRDTIQRLVVEANEANARVSSASNIDAITSEAETALANAAEAKNRDDREGALVWYTVAANAYSVSSGLADPSPETFRAARTGVFDAADSAATLCADGAPDPRLGNQCALAFAMRRTNDSLVAAHAFETAAIAGKWQAAEVAAKAFESEVSNNWQKYASDVADLTNADQDATPYQEMVERSACGFQRAQGIARLITEHGKTTEAQPAIDAYYNAAVSAANFIGVEPQSPDACGGEASGSKACQGSMERGLSMFCDKFNTGQVRD